MAGGHAPGGAVVGVTIALTIVAAISTSLRLFTRAVIVRNAGIDDICIVAATVFSIMLTITISEQVENGMGRHFDTLTDLEQMRSQQWMWASIWVYYLALGAVKCSILLQYLRIFPYDGFRMACYIMITIIVIYTSWTFFSAIFACTPVSFFWNPSLNGHCLNRLAVWFSNAAVNIVTDIATATLPLPVLKGLQLPRRQKAILMAVFGLGGLTCIISILRLQSLYVISKATDYTWENPLAAIWSCTEVNIGILCSCIPTLKGCVARYFPRIFTDPRSRPSVLEIPGSQPFTPARGDTFSQSKQNTYIGDGSRGSRKQRAAHQEDGSIHIVTVLEQEVEMEPRGGGESPPYEWESMRNLVSVPETSYHGI